jgi:eukaryotic-like serine/threonine-protein kinase
MTYKVGDVIGRYIVTRDFDSANGGQCQWGFAKYGAEEFFIKKFLNPVYPGEKSPGSEKGKQKKRDQCHQFERKQYAIIKALSSCGDGGLVVRTIDCFKHGDNYGEHYFKVSQKVDTSSLSNRVHTLDKKQRLFVMLTAAGALNILHRNGIIHLDLKPDNILIQEFESRLIAKIIDFDSSMLEGESISSDMLVGDPVYYSPEFASHIATRGDTPPPNKQSDVFSLGLIFCKYWTGSLPSFPSIHNYAHEAVLKGENLKISSLVAEPKTSLDIKTSRVSGTLIKPKDKDAGLNPIDAGFQHLLKKMLLLNPVDRCSISEVHKSLKYLYHHGELPSITAKDEPKETGSRISFGKNMKR